MEADTLHAPPGPSAAPAASGAPPGLRAAFAANHPTCLHCEGPARPNIDMFDDAQYVHDEDEARGGGREMRRGVGGIPFFALILGLLLRIHPTPASRGP